MGDRKIDWRALDRKVIVVAAEGYVKDWAAYIGAVPGERHEDEWEEVLEHGSKLSPEVAKILFPNFKRLHYRG